MIVLRCTQRLLKAGGPSVSVDPPAPTIALGEWFANAVPLPLPGRWVVMYTHASTLLTVVVPGRVLRTTLSHLQRRARELLHRLELPAEWIEQQSSGMAEVIFARTNDRRVLGSMNDLAYQIQTVAVLARSFERIDWDRVELELAEVPLSLLNHRGPHAVTQELARRERDPESRG